MILLRFISLFTLFFCGLTLSTYAQENTPPQCSEGLSYNENLGRCLSDSNTSQAQIDTLECSQLPIGQREECHKQAAQRAMDESNLTEGVQTPTIIAGLNLAIGTYTLVNIKTVGCKSLSLKFLKAAGLLNAVNEVGTFLWYRAGLQGLNKKYDSLVDKKVIDIEKTQEDSVANAVSAQSEAFKFMQKKEELFEKVSKTKAGVYYTAGALFAAASVLAAFESLNIATLAPCLTRLTPNSSETLFEGKAEPGILSKALALPAFFISNKLKKNSYYKNQTSPYYLTNSQSLLETLLLEQEQTDMEEGRLSSPTLQSYYETRDSLTLLHEHEKLNNYFKLKEDLTGLLLSSAHAENSNLSNFAVTKAINKAGNAISQALGKAPTRAIISGALSAASLVMGKNAVNQGKKANDRKNYMKRLIKNFELTASQSISQCTSHDRENPLKPDCYCYNPDKSKNANRTNSAICDKHWKENPSLAPTKTASDEETQNSDNPKFCVNNEQRFDYECSCAKEGNCLKILTGGLDIGHGLPDFGTLGKDANNLSNGNLGGGDINTDTQGSQAMKLQETADKMMESQPLASTIAEAEAQLGPLLKDYPQDLKSAYAKASGLGGQGSSSSLPSQVAREIEKKMKKETPEEVLSTLKYAQPTSGQTSTSGQGQGSDISFDFGNTDSNGGQIQVEDIPKPTEFELDQNSAIRQESHGDIFQILSLRYKKSALRRIFGNDEQQEQVEASGKSEIHQ